MRRSGHRGVVMSTGPFLMDFDCLPSRRESSISGKGMRWAAVTPPAGEVGEWKSETAPTNLLLIAPWLHRVFYVYWASLIAEKCKTRPTDVWGWGWGVESRQTSLRTGYLYLPLRTDMVWMELREGGCHVCKDLGPIPCPIPHTPWGLPASPMRSCLYPVLLSGPRNMK